MTSPRCEPLFGILDEVLLSCQNSITLESAHTLLRTLTSDPKLSGGLDSGQLLEEVLDGVGFGGLWRSSTFNAASEQDRQRTLLTDRLIEVRCPAPTDNALMLTKSQLIIA